MAEILYFTRKLIGKLCHLICTIFFPLSPPLFFLQNQKLQILLVFSAWKFVYFITTFLSNIYSSRVTYILFPKSYNTVGHKNLKANSNLIKWWVSKDKHSKKFNTSCRLPNSTISGFKIIYICQSIKVFCGHIFHYIFTSTISAFHLAFVNNITSDLVSPFHGKEFIKQQESYFHFLSDKYMSYSCRHLYFVDITFEQGFACEDYLYLLLVFIFPLSSFLTPLIGFQYYGWWSIFPVGNNWEGPMVPPTLPINRSRCLSGIIQSISGRILS